MANHNQDQLNVANPTDAAFTVHWGRNPFTLAAGRSVIWPRFIAEHFAKHLTDSILLKREEKEKEAYRASGRPMSEFIAPALLNSRQERPKVVDTIILGVYSYYTPQGGGRAAEIQQEIDRWNQPQAQPAAEAEKVADLGVAADPLLGVLEDNDEDEVVNPPAPTPTPTQPTPVAAVQQALDGPPAPIAPPIVQAPVVPPVEPIQPTTPGAPAGETPLAKRARLMREAKQLGIKTNPNMTTEMLEAEMKKQYA
jgi:hypothetical protein